MCGRGITNYRNVSGLSIRVSPSHPYNAGRAGLGWRGGWLRANVYDAISDCSVLCSGFGTRRPSSLEAFGEKASRGRSAFFYYKFMPVG